MKFPSVNVFKKAYKECGLKPLNGDWYEKGCCCPLSAIALYKGVVNKKMSLEKRTEKTVKWANETFGDKNVDLFTMGVDSYGLCHSQDYIKEAETKYGFKVFEEVSKGV